MEVGRVDEDQVESSPPGDESLDCLDSVPLEDLSSIKQVESIQVPSDQAACGLRVVDKETAPGTSGERLQPDCPRSGEEVKAGGARYEVRDDVEERASNEVPDRANPALLPIEQPTTFEDPANDSHPVTP